MRLQLNRCPGGSCFRNKRFRRIFIIMNCLALSGVLLYLIVAYSGLAESTEVKKGPKVTDKVRMQWLC